MRGTPICLIVMALIGFSALADQDAAPTPGADTPLCDYRAYFRAKISERWYSEMAKNNKGSLRYGTVKIRFTMHSDGTISDLSILEGDSAGLLRTVSINVLLDSAPYKPFSEAPLKEMGSKYVDDMCFSDVPLSNHGMTPAEAERRVAAPSPD